MKLLLKMSYEVKHCVWSAEPMATVIGVQSHVHSSVMVAVSSLQAIWLCRSMC